MRSARSRLSAPREGTNRTYILIRNDLHVLHMPRRLENLSQHIFRHSRVQPANIQGTFVRLWCGTTHSPARTARRHHPACGKRRSHGGWDRIVILRNNDRRQWRRRHVGRIALTVCGRAILLLAGCRRGLRWRRQGSDRGRGRGLRHCCGVSRRGKK
jgi:hypothetical protein